MRKYLVLVIVVLLAAVLFVRYLEREETPPAPPSSAPQGEEGVPLPPAAKTLTLPEFSPQAYQPTSRLGGTAQAPAPEISPLAVSSDPCLRETKVKDIIANYDKWRLLPKDKVKTQAERERSAAVLKSAGWQPVGNLVARIGGYQACLSLAGDKDLCVALPTEGGGSEDDMLQVCREALDPIGLVGYSLGKSGRSFCSSYFKFGLAGADGQVRESEFCDIASGGLPAINGRLCPGLPPEMKRLCLETFPKGISGCKDDECVRMWRVYEAVKSNSTGGLPHDLQPLVLAIIHKKAEHCRPLADAIVQEYCQLKSGIDQQMMMLEMTRKQHELNKELRSGRETQSAD
ncbi:MAG: hypothetical protein FD189_242 [Elusimicrobia bacterium]|nr:MAG: hypothetical protein FD154_42 [Elusimicrobiota bacterium]KAF0157975.1 MAG: hypothetical protein FD189_242 [Elusimicrobiota bacterium]